MFLGLLQCLTICVCVLAEGVCRFLRFSQYYFFLHNYFTNPYDLFCGFSAVISHPTERVIGDTESGTRAAQDILLSCDELQISRMQFCRVARCRCSSHHAYHFYLSQPLIPSRPVPSSS
eukprot:GHVR01117855.1.p1 GENE.GHVR01117855.1~~GHVR01117855.1.p1  ORF type:complete len:119 (-),score=4.62 GHVR01117855.1:111-467(-)